MTEFEQAIASYAKVVGVSKQEAKEDAERIIAEMMKTQHVPREFAEATFIEEQEDASAEELDKIEQKAKANGTTKVGAKKAVPNYSLEGKKKRERKPNEIKRLLIRTLLEAVQAVADFVQAVADTEEHKIDFTVGDTEYTVTLTAHRKKKEK